MQIYSFDVFDTLITRRTATPTGVFLLVQERLASRGCEATLTKTFRENRIKAEHEARRQSKREEITFEEIYVQLERLSGASHAAILIAQALELEVEQEVSQPVPARVRQVKMLLEAGHRVVLISDMYLPKEVIQNLLSKADPQLANACQLYVSSMIMKTKTTGTLFNHVCEVEGVRPRQVTHFGDNRRSDVTMARSIGMKAEFVSEAALRSWEQIGKNESNLFWQLTAGAARCRRLKFPALQDCIGYALAGPILGAFISWALLEASARGTRQLYFVARDGYVLLKIAEILQPSCAPEIAKMHYVYGSRQAWRLPAMVNYGLSDVRWALAGEKRTSLNGISRRLGIKSCKLREMLSSHGVNITSEYAFLTANEIQQIEQVLLQPVIADHVKDKAKSQFELLSEYLQNLGMFSHDTITIVDLGWNGSMQDALQRMLRAMGQSNRTVGLYFGTTSNAAVSDKVQKVSFAASVRDAPLHPDQFQTAAPFLEALATACHGSTSEYVRDGDGSVGPLLDDQGRSLVTWGYQQLAEAAVESVRDNADLFSRGENFRDALVMTKEFLRYLDSEVLESEFAECFGSFPFSPDSDATRVDELGPRRTCRDALRFAFGNSQQRNEISVWPRATAVRSGGIVSICFSPRLRIFGVLAQPWRAYDFVPLWMSKRIKAVLPRPMVRLLEKLIFGRTFS